MRQALSRLIYPFIVLVLILPTLWPLFRSDFFRMHDYTHVARLVELNLALKDGQIPPRWSLDFGWGYGMPLFHFYPPLPYYLAEILYFLGTPAVWAIKAIFALNFFAGFYFMYLWAKEFWGKFGGFVSALAFVYLPYRAVLFYVRGALAELTAMTFLPLFFYGALQLFKTRKTRYLVITTLAIVGVFLSHNVIALFAIGFFALYWLVQILFGIKREKKRLILPWKGIGLALLAALWAFALSAFFIVPAFLEKDETIVSSIAGGYSYYPLHFIYLRQLFDRRWAYGGSVSGPYDDISFQLGWPHVVLAGLSLLAFITAVKRKDKRTLTALAYCYLASLVAVFLMTFHSQPIWDRLTILHLAQFPWRLLTFTGVCLAFLSGSIWWLIRKRILRILLAALVTIAILGLNLTYFRPEKYSPVNDFYYTDRGEIQSKMSGVLSDYLPKTAKKDVSPPAKAYDFAGEVEDWQQRTGYYSFKSQSSQEAKFLLSVFYFPGWKVFVDGKETIIDWQNELGQIEFSLPGGVHQVRVVLTKTPVQLWSDRLSLVSWLTLLTYLAWSLKKKGYETT